MNKRDRRILELSAGVLLIMGVTFFVLEFGAERIVDFIGAENAYVVTFLVALFGGMTSIGAPTYITTVLTFVSGGATLWIVAVAASGGTIIGDTLYYVISRRGRTALPDGKFKEISARFAKWVEDQNDFVAFLVATGYIGLTPFPNDLMTIGSGVSGIAKKVMIPAIIVGDIIYSFVLVYLGQSLFA